MRKNRLLGFLIVMLAIASFLFLVGFSHVNHHYNLTEKITPVIKDLKEKIIKRKVEYTAQRELDITTKGMVIVPPPIDFPLDVPLLNQMAAPRLRYGCEVTSLAMLLQYEGFAVSKNELADEIATVPVTYEDGLRGHPNQGFIGEMAEGPGFSVWHQPIFELAQQYVGDRAVDITGSNPSKIYDYLDEGMPVWIIIPTTFAPVDDFVTWDTPQGQVEISYKSHSAVVTGYTDDSVFVNDPYGTKNKKVDRSKFEAAWVQMGSQAIVIVD